MQVQSRMLPDLEANLNNNNAYFNIMLESTEECCVCLKLSYNTECDDCVFEDGCTEHPFSYITPCCGHELCAECIVEMAIQLDDDYNWDTRYISDDLKCPMCRSNISKWAQAIDQAVLLW